MHHDTGDDPAAMPLYQWVATPLGDGQRTGAAHLVAGDLDATYTRTPCRSVVMAVAAPAEARRCRACLAALPAGCRLLQLVSY